MRRVTLTSASDSLVFGSMRLADVAIVSLYTSLQLDGELILAGNFEVNFEEGIQFVEHLWKILILKYQQIRYKLAQRRPQQIKATF